MGSVVCIKNAMIKTNQVMNLISCNLHYIQSYIQNWLS